jgi:hypothetical protein
VVRPERRTRADLAAAVLILVALLGGGVFLWQHSDARATLSQTSPRTPEQSPRAAVPDTVTEAWRAPSSATPEPVAAGPAAVTAEGNEVIGHDPVTGQVRWRYARDIPLCTVSSEWGRALAVYRKSLNCSEVTSLEGKTGERGPQRNGDAELGTHLLTDGTYVTATGHGVVETWRSDLVRTQQYGVPPAPKNPGNNLTRPQCRYTSASAGDQRVGLIEQCPQESGNRITVIKARPKDDETPEELFSTGTGSSDATMVAVNETRAAAVLRDRGELVVYNKSASQQGAFPVRVPNPGPPGPVRIERTVNGSPLLWYTGQDTVALDPSTLIPMWTVRDTLGPGTRFGQRLLVPVTDGVAVVDPKSGGTERVIPVDRHGYRGPIGLKSLGSVLLEQRGGELVALR